MKWKHDQYQWYYILIFSVAFGAPMTLVFKSTAMGIPVGFLFGLSIALALAKKHQAAVEGNDLVFGVGDELKKIPLGEIEHLDFDQSKGEMIVRTGSGDLHTLDAGWDKKGLAKFVADVKQKYRGFNSGFVGGPAAN